jgi:UDP-N-acetylmuramoyl-tripeptide--D-alanyl-D-alanine ligase
MKLLLPHAAMLMQGRGEFPATELVRGYSIDSRSVGAGELFFAVRGERLDGHDYVGAALDRGAVAAVVQAGWHADGMPENQLLHVDDPLAAMQRLAGAVRRQWGKRVIGVTGSAGKTTTKDAVATVLASRFNVLKTQGNLNNGFGVPLQLLRLEPEHDVAVIEMGMNHAGEIRDLCVFTQPDWAVITNVGMAHTENFADGIAGVARAKYELVAALPHGGVAVLNGDDAYVSQFGRDFDGKVIYYGTSATADLRAVEIEELGATGVRFRIEAGDESGAAEIKLLGRHNVLNALAAIAVGMKSGIPLGECARAMGTMTAGDKRGELIDWHGAAIVNDSYNSNPAALKAMVATLMAMPARRRIVIAGEMLELGDAAAELHADCGRYMASAGVNVALGVRGNAMYIVEGAAAGGAEALFVESAEVAGAWMRENLRDGDAVLVKGSRGVQLELALKILAE